MAGETARSGCCVSLERRGQVSLVTLRRPRSRNALSAGMLRELGWALAQADHDEHTGAIVLTGVGPAFCAGDDLLEAAQSTVEDFEENIRMLQEVSRILLDSDKPSIAALNGAAIGGGLELTLACDLRIAAEYAVFACPEVAWGLVVTNGASVLLPAVVGQGRARDMMLTGRTYGARWAQSAGLVSEVLPSDDVLDHAITLADELASRPRAVGLTRQLLRDAAGDAARHALAREASAVGKARRGAEAAAGMRRAVSRFGMGGT